jgi:hypothetical protein
MCLLAGQHWFASVHVPLLSYIDAGEHEWLCSINYCLDYVFLLRNGEERCLVHLDSLIETYVLVIQFLVHEVQLLQLVQSGDVLVVQHFALEISFLEQITSTAELYLLCTPCALQLCDSNRLRLHLGWQFVDVTYQFCKFEPTISAETVLQVNLEILRKEIVHLDLLKHLWVLHFHQLDFGQGLGQLRSQVLTSIFLYSLLIY